MAISPGVLPRLVARTGGGVLLLALVSCAQLPPTASVAIPPIPAGEARVWFYRDGGPYESQQRPYARMNEGIVGISEPSGAFYRDVAPGHYRVSVDSYLSDPHQTRDVDLAAGQQMYFKVLVQENACGGGGGDGGGGDSNCQRPNFYVWIVPPQDAQEAVARTPFYPGGS